MDEKNKFDLNLMLTFLFQFKRFEKALKQAGFMKTGRPDEADWQAFICKIDGRFDLKASVELEMAVDFMLVSYAKSGKPYPLRDVILLADEIKGLGRRLSRSINFQAPTSEEYDTMMAALVIMDAWFDLM